MAASVRSVSTATNNNAVALPAGYDSANDVLIFFCGTVGGSVTPPTNVTLISGLQGTFSGWRQEAFESRVALTGTQTFNTGGSYTDLWCICVQNADRTATPVGTNNTGTGTTATMTSVAVATADSLLLLGSVSGVGARSGGPAGMTAASGSPIDTNFYVDFQEVDPSSTGTRTSTYSSQDWIMQGVVVAAPGGGGGGTVARRTLLGVGKYKLDRAEWQRREDSRIYTRRAA